MSRFYVSAQGSRGGTTRQGTSDSGIESHTRGWNLGVLVRGYVNSDGEDEFTVYVTSGSNGRKPNRLAFTIGVHGVEPGPAIQVE